MTSVMKKLYVYRRILIIFLWLLVAIVNIDRSDARGEGSCPTVCACKWKGGKQTVECIDRSMYAIPENMDPSTQVLDMSGNNLQILPRETFIKTDLTNLQKVYLRNCRLGQIDDEAFKGLSNLIELDLSQNLLTSVPSATFVEIPSLRDLVLSRNPIQKIDGYGFRAIPNLIKLDLSHCELHMIAPKAFEDLDLLQTLRLNGNKLSELQTRTIETLSGLHNIELHDNPWFCDCRLRVAKVWLTDQNIPYPVDPVCAGGPERVVDRKFDDLSVDDFACKPQMLPVNRDIEGVTGENATVICKANAVPAATINWYWNGRRLVNDSHFSTYQRVYIFESGYIEKQSKLVLTNAQEIDSTEFYCVAENRAGSSEANFTLHVMMPTAAKTLLGSGQMLGLSAALVIIILFILLIILFLLVRLRRIPFSESKTPGQLEVLTTVSPPNNQIGKIKCTNSSDVNTIERKVGNDMKMTNPVQKPPRLTDLPYSTNHYDGNGSILSTVPGYLSPTASVENNPDLINDTKRLGSNGDLNGASAQPPTEPESRGSGEYSRAGCDSLYPSGIWEVTPNTKNIDANLKRAKSTALPDYNCSDKTPIIDSAAMDTTDSQADFMSRTFPRTSTSTTASSASTRPEHKGGYPSDYGLPIVPGAEQTKSRDILPPPGMPQNAKTLRVWQRGGVPVLPPVNALKRALSHNRNSPDEGYQEGCGTDV